MVMYNNTDKDKLEEVEWCHYSDLPSPSFYMNIATASVNTDEVTKINPISKPQPTHTPLYPYTYPS
jgi:hypothetical protein